jgi:hypothetical protein
VEYWIFWGVAVLLVLGAVLILGAPPPVQLPYKVVITKIEPIGDDEVVYIRNEGKEIVDLSDWRLTTPPFYEFKFPKGCLLAPGAILKIHSGPGSTIHKPFLRDEPPCRPNGDLLWSLQHIWCDQNGDTAYLWDSKGNQVDKFEYGAGWHESPFVPCNRAGEE